MSVRHSVKAREHHGAKSLDLTIPAAVCEQYGLRAGDVYALEVTKEGPKVILLYARIA
jgi:hypothetical protein